VTLPHDHMTSCRSPIRTCPPQMATLSGIMLALMALPGCISPNSDSMTSKMTNLLMFQSTTPPKPTNQPPVSAVGLAAEPPADYTAACPPVVIVDSGAAIRSYGGQVGDSSGLRNQVSINDVARECVNANRDGSFLLKIGVQGRVLIGPAGTPGTYQANLRMVVKRGGKIVANRVARVGATIGAGQGNADFVHVEEGIQVPGGTTDPDIEVSLEGGSAARPSRRR
jgi:hypothetical protein